MSCCSLGIGLVTARGLCNAASDWVGSCVITFKKRREAVEAPQMNFLTIRDWERSGHQKFTNRLGLGRVTFATRLVRPRR
jgi:hypothetical protein